MLKRMLDNRQAKPGATRCAVAIFLKPDKNVRLSAVHCSAAIPRAIVFNRKLGKIDQPRAKLPANGRFRLPYLIALVIKFEQAARSFSSLPSTEIPSAHVELQRQSFCRNDRL